MIKSPRDVCVQCIDGFQGEENQVIVLSLTSLKKKREYQNLPRGFWCLFQELNH
jgi:superfamily I DNA and/or RNA helicase